MDELLELLSPELREKVESGEYRVAPGQNALKPYVTDAATGRVVKGSGRPLGANDPAQVARTSAYKKTKNYSQAMELMVPVEKNSPGAIMSFEELLEQARKLVIPENRRYTKDCPVCHENGLRTQVTFQVERAPDVKTLIFLIERLAGEAAKTTDVNVHSEEIVRVLHDQRILQQVEIVTLSADERAERIRRVIDA